MEPFEDPFWDPFWDQIGPRGAKMGPRGPSRASKYRKTAFAKTLKNQWFFKVFANVGFRYFGALDGPLGPILAPLGPIWSQNSSQNESPDGSKSIQDGPSWRTRGTGSACRSYLKSSCFQDGAKMAQDGPEKPKIASWEPSWAFRGCLGRPWTPQKP